MELRSVTWLVLAGALFLSLPHPVRAGEPTERIRGVIDQGIQIINDPRFKSEDKKKERLDRLRKIVYPLFDFTEMAKRALGRHWRRRTPVERKEFVKLFAELLERSYAGKIDLYKGERVVFTHEVADGRYARVDSKVIDPKGREYSVRYKLLRVNGDWKIYDVVIENISLVNNYRSQFNRVIRKSSFRGLVEKIKQKLDGLSHL